MRVARLRGLLRSPGGLFWKVFLACWLTAMLTGVGMSLIAQLLPGLVQLPRPPTVGQSVFIPVITGACVALGLSGALAWNLSGPIRLLRQAFSDAAKGYLDRRVAPLLDGQHDEFAELGRDYDLMAQRLQVLLGAQRRLLHDVSHELRSPLARLQMAVGLLRRSPEGLEVALQRIEQEVQRLDALVGEVLMLARLESHAALGGVREVDVLALLASVAEDARFEARATGRELDFHTVPTSLVLAANGELLLRAFENVIRNAVKYTAPGTRVEVRASLQMQSLKVEVADRGPGLPAEALLRIFEPFVRHESVKLSAGFGLGLAIARRALESHGGAITASPREGGGLCFTLSLPVPGPALAADLNQT